MHKYHPIKYQKKKTNSSTILTKLFKVNIRPKLEYNTQISSPYLKKDIDKIESVQSNFTPFICTGLPRNLKNWNLRNFEKKTWKNLEF